MRMAWLLLLLPSVFGISFGEYAFWFPEVPDRIVLHPCASLSQTLFLTPAAAQKPGFSQGIQSALLAVEQFKAARQWALLQASPIILNQGNAAVHFLASSYCHRHAAQGLRLAVDAVNHNWEALDAQIADVEFMGMQNLGPTGRVFSALKEAERDIQSRDKATESLGSAFVRALGKTQDAVEAPLLAREAAVQLIGPRGLLEAQVRIINDIQKARENVEDQYHELGDDVTQRLQDARRLQADVDAEKLFLVPENAFRVASADYTQTGTVQSFPALYKQAQNGIQDGAEEQKNAERTWKEKERGFGARSLDYLDAARQHADAAVAGLTSVKRQGENLEKDVLTSVESLVQRLGERKSDDAVLEYRRLQAIETSQNPLADTQGERILQLVHAHDMLEEVQKRFLSPVDQVTEIRRELARVENLISRAEKDGVTVDAEKQAWQALQSVSENVEDAEPFLGKLDELHGQVIAAAQKRFASLPKRRAALAAYQPFILLPQGLGESDELVWSDAIGSLKGMAEEMERLESTVEKQRRTWLLDHLEKNRRVQTASTSVRADEPATQTIHVTYANQLDFGDEDPLFLAWPEAVPKDATLIQADAGLRVLSGTLLLKAVEPHSEYSATWQANATPVRTLSWVEKTRHASTARIVREVTWTYSSSLEQPVQLEHDFGHEVNQVTGLADAAINQGVLHTVVPAVTGKNTAAFSYVVENPVIVAKHADEGAWKYTMRNTLPFAYSLEVEFQEITACPMASTDFYVASPSENLRILSANVTLDALEEKTRYATLDCPKDSLANQTKMFSGLPTLSSEQKRVLTQAEDALTQGRTDDAAWWLFQLQAPHFQPDLLAQARTLAGASEAAQTLFASAQDAMRRGDETAAKQWIQQLEDHVETERNVVQGQLTALCAKCPEPVEKIRADAENFLFTGQLQKARDALARARPILEEHERQQQAEDLDLQAALEALDEVGWPQVPAFQTAFDVPASVTNWRGRQPNYQSAKKNHEALSKNVAQLDEYRKRAAEGKAVTGASIRLVLDGARTNAEKLDADLAQARQNAKDAVDVAQKAVQQFGAPSDKTALKEAEEALAENRFALAQFSAEQVAGRTQKNPATAHLAAEPGTLAVGVGALVVLGALAYHFRKPEKPLEEL
ncbi:hypothetical protein HY572_06280 [Candidatus Micrarchaeota archaeon]|nr:hypothetical protein [Candidatus Micrarchaeota archaeon]